MRLLTYNARYMGAPFTLDAPFHSLLLMWLCGLAWYCCSATFRGYFCVGSLLGMAGALYLCAFVRCCTALSLGTCLGGMFLALGLAWVPGGNAVLSFFSFVGVAIPFTFGIANPLIVALRGTLDPRVRMIENWDERLEVLMSKLGEYDVVCLQEVFSLWGIDSHVRALKQRAASEGLVHSYTSGKWPRFPAVTCNDGLMVLSRFPIDRAEVRSFRQQAAIDAGAVARGAMMVRLLVEGSTVSLLNLHATSGNSFLWSSFGMVSTISPHSMQQASEALAAFRSFADPAGLRIVCGDFNIKFKGTVDEMLSREGMSNAYPDCPPTFGRVGDDGAPTESVLTEPADIGTQRVLDYVFASEHGCRMARLEEFRAPESAKGWQQVSDHVGIAVHF